MYTEFLKKRRPNVKYNSREYWFENDESPSMDSIIRDPLHEYLAMRVSIRESFTPVFLLTIPITHRLNDKHTIMSNLFSKHCGTLSSSNGGVYTERHSSVLQT